MRGFPSISDGFGQHLAHLHNTLSVCVGKDMRLCHVFGAPKGTPMLDGAARHDKTPSLDRCTVKRDGASVNFSGNHLSNGLLTDQACRRPTAPETKRDDIPCQNHSAPSPLSQFSALRLVTKTQTLKTLLSLVAHVQASLPRLASLIVTPPLPQQAVPLVARWQMIWASPSNYLASSEVHHKFGSRADHWSVRLLSF